MARMHGKDIRVYLGVRDVSSDLGEVNVEPSADTHDVTTFGKEDHEFDPGLQMVIVSFAGFYQPQVGGIGRQLEGLLGATGSIVTIIGNDALSELNIALCMPNGILKSVSQPMKVDDMVKISGQIQCSGRPGLRGNLLGWGTATVTGNSNSADGGASSAGGGRANLHVLSVTGTWTVKIQHSTDNLAWSDLITFTQFTAATSETIEVAGTVNRYVRGQWTEDVPGTAEFTVAFSRY